MDSPLLDLIYLFGVAFGICLILTPFVRGLARRWGLVDQPDGRRKIHKTPTPVCGGVAVYLAASTTMAGALWLMPTFRANLGLSWSSFLALFLAASVIAVVGLIDDFRGLRGRYKLGGQILAALIVVAGGVVVRHVTILNVPIDLGMLAVPFTLFWLLGAINSLNLIDGMDGLLGSIGLILCLTIGGMAFMNGNFAAACVAVTLGGSLLAFLGFNLPPASIFLGDAGSMLIGLVVGTLAIQASLKGPAAVALAAPLALMIIPIFDTSAAIVRRRLTGRSIFTTDRGHLHHILMGGGLSNKKVLLLVAVLCCIAGGGALFGTYLQNEFIAFGSAVAVVVILMVRKLFGFAELLLVKERVASLVNQVRHGHEHGRIHQIKVHLQGSANWNSLWRDLTAAAQELGLKTMTLDVNAPAIHEQYHARWDRTNTDQAEASGYWRVEIPLTVNRNIVGRFDVVGLRGEESAWQKLAALAKLVEDIELSIAAMGEANEPPPMPSLMPAKGLHLGGL
jgi:UDP-GlcNAc:undecaprenyl-phosphate/decaprenyl-phosphate GlcNAc-1-phosphate transferase